MTLYEITENITEEPEEAVTIKEASKRLNRTVGIGYMIRMPEIRKAKHFMIQGNGS